VKYFRVTAFLPFLSLPVLLIFLNCSKPAPPPKTAEQTVHEVAQGLASHQPRAVWDALPASYQKDLEGMVHETALKMDSDLWKKGFVLADKAVKVLKTQKGLLLTSKMLNNSPVGPAKLSENWDALVNLAEVIVRSELSDLEKLKHLDLGQFLSGTGAEFLKRLDALSTIQEKETTPRVSQQFKSIKTTVLQSDTDAVRIKIELPDAVSWEIALVKVEGKWIPKSAADQWKTEVDQARKAMAQWSATFAEDEKQRLLGVMNSVDGILDQMLAAKTPQDLESALAQGFGLLLGMALGKG